jgi:general secretion pathway protein D
MALMYQLGRWNRLLVRRRGFLSAFILCVIMGCATPEVAAPPRQPAPRRLPVQVLAPTPKPPAYADLLKKAQKESDIGEENLERYATRIKKVSRTKRTPPKGEKVYPIDLNLKNADLVEAIRVLAGTMELNYSIDPKVKGNVNVRASGKLSQSDLLAIMETLLSINGATMIKTGELYSIVPAEKAATRGVPVYSQGAVPPGMRAQVVFLEQTPVKEVIEALKPLVSPSGNIGPAAHNSLVLVESPDNLDKLLQLIYLMDTRALSQTAVRVVRVHNTDPNEIIRELETIFSAYGTLSKQKEADFGVHFLPVNRLNAIMVLANSSPLMERALYWLRQLDLKSVQLANIHIYNVENYKAKNLANILSQVYGGGVAAPTIKETKPAGTRGGAASTLSGARSTGTAMGGTEAGMGAGGMGMGGMGATGTGTGMGTPGMGTGSPSGTQGASAAETGGLGQAGGAAALKERAAGTAGTEGVSPKEGVRIIPDEENNLLVVVAPPHEWNIISRLLKQLDIMPRQVLNEVLVAEVRLTDDLKYGIEFLIGGVPTAVQTASGTQTTSGVPAGALVTGSTQPQTTTTVTGPSGNTVTGSTIATIPGVTVSNAAAAAFTAAGGLTFAAVDTANKLKGLINLLAAEGKVDILASPHIMAANNQEARIMIGQDVPILSSQSTPLISQATSFQTNTVEYRSTGIILSVKPQINAKGLVTLEIAQEVSDATPTTTGVGGSPTFTIRQAKTQLITKDNQTIVLGGLIREDTTNTSAGVPGLRKMPLLGPLFGSQGVSKQKTELIVLITPHIVSNLEEGAMITHQMKDRVGLEETKKPRKPVAPPPASTSSPQIREVAPPPE